MEMIKVVFRVDGQALPSPELQLEHVHELAQDNFFKIGIVVSKLFVR